ncbi:amidase family protein [Mycobacterium kansasii]|uniref:amidase n=1 Tax=Mycobacterium kansasii TaxID=1768 RepID=A0A1V3XNI1_MYCKA|nr:amidase family protein [Mycobacterium kansasii]
MGIKPQRGRISTWPLPEAFNGITVNGVLARTVADAALVLDAASGNVEGDLHRPPPVTASDYVGIAPGPLKIALSTRAPFNGFRAKLHPEILAATRQVGEQLQLLGHTVVRGNPDYSVQMSWDFLARSTAGLWEWAQRLGDDVTLDPRTVSNLRTGHMLSQAILRSARRHEAAAHRRVGSIFDIVDVVLAPTTALPRRWPAPSTRWAGWPPTAPLSPRAPTRGHGICWAGRRSTCRQGSPSRACRSVFNSWDRPTAKAC